MSVFRRGVVVLLGLLVGCSESKSAIKLVEKTQLNRMAFRQVYCEFRLIVGTVNDANDAKSSVLSTIIGEARGRYSKDGNMESLVVQESTIPESFSYPSKYPAYLKNGQIEFVVFGSGKEAGIGNSNWKLSTELSPWYGYVWGNGIADEFAISRLKGPAKQSARVREKDRLLEVSVDSQEMFRVVLDPRWNHLAVATSGGPTVLEAEEVKGIGYFPKVKYSMESTTSDWPRNAYRWELTKLENRKPSEEEMSFLITSDCAVVPFMDVESVLSLKPQEIVTPTRVNSIYDEIQTIKFAEQERANFKPDPKVLQARLQEASAAISIQSNAPKLITNSLKMELVLMQPGAFIMGSASNEMRRKDDETQHVVQISEPFYVGKTEVTQGQWEMIYGPKPGATSTSSTSEVPMTNISWQQAEDFCRKLGEREGRIYHLPTEAQWEYSCRSGTTTVYSFGDDESQLNAHCWSLDSQSLTPYVAYEVAKKSPNPSGLFDMHGNVYEMCSDWYFKRYYLDSPEIDPKGPSEGKWRVCRGGSWRDRRAECRSASRSNSKPDSGFDGLGFRVISPVPEQDK